MQALLGLAAALVAIALMARTLQVRRADKVAPGGSVKTAIRIEDFSDIDYTVALRRCQCRGKYAPLGEGPVNGAAQIRRVRIECRECGRENELYFDLTDVDNPIWGS